MDISPGKRIWRHRSGEVVLGERTQLMGIVNVTPDSFSDGGEYLEPDAAVDHACRLAEEGADLLDFGAESTRPGSDGVSAAEQIERLLPVIERVVQRVRVPISVDTSCAEVADACLRLGSSIVNDITGLRGDSAMPGVCARYEAGVIVMHMRGTPRTMQLDTTYTDLIGEIRTFLAESVSRAVHAGVSRNRIIVDPGIGFGKSFEQNYKLLGSLEKFRDLASGVLVGPSRKRFTGEFCGLPPEQRTFPTAAAVCIAALHGADIVRVHDPAEIRQVTDIIDRFRTIHGNCGRH